LSRRKENKKKKSRQQKISHAKTTSQGDRQPETFDRTYANHDVFGRPGSVTEIRGASSATTTLEYNLLSGSPTETHPSDHPYLPDLKVEARADDQRGRPTGHIVKSDGTSIHGWTTGYDTEGRVGSLEGHNLTASLAYHPGTKRLATQTTAPTGGGNPILTRATNIDLLGRTYGVIHTAPDPDAGNTPRVVTALAHGHDIQGRRKSARREDGTTWSYNYNDRSEVTGAEKRQSNSDLVPGLDFGYNHDGLGNRLSASKGLPALVTTYAPDAMNRYSTIESPGSDDILVRSATAVEVEVDETPVAVTTSGDFRGARVTATNTTAPAFPEITITGQDNFAESGNRWIPQAEFSPTYDDHGNLTNDGRWIYTWDAMNRLTGMTPTTVALTAGVPNQTLSFAYDHLGRRIAKKVTTTTGGNTTIKDWRYLYEGWNVVAQFTAVTSNAITPDATYLWSLDLSGTFHGAGGVGGLHSVKLYSGGQAGTLCLASYDANGNIIAWTDATGRILQRQDYDPFGNRVIRERLAISAEQSDRLEYGFSTKPLDAETGLIYYIHRYYGPRHGRWLSVDPIGERGGINTGSFCMNDPLSLIDDIGCQPIAPPYYGLNPHTARLLAEIAKDLGATVVVAKTVTELVDERKRPLAPPVPNAGDKVTEEEIREVEQQIERLLKENSQTQPERRDPKRAPPKLDDRRRQSRIYYRYDARPFVASMGFPLYVTDRGDLPYDRAISFTYQKEAACLYVYKIFDKRNSVGPAPPDDNPVVHGINQYMLYNTIYFGPDFIRERELPRPTN
jgi:RHS repeat-associated protein